MSLTFVVTWYVSGNPVLRTLLSSMLNSYERITVYRGKSILSREREIIKYFRVFYFNSNLLRNTILAEMLHLHRTWQDILNIHQFKSCWMNNWNGRWWWNFQWRELFMFSKKKKESNSDAKIEQNSKVPMVLFANKPIISDRFQIEAPFDPLKW